MTALALVQILCAAFIGAVTLGVLGVVSWGRFLAVGAILAFATPLALSCAFVVPDVFSGFVIATLILMALFLALWIALPVMALRRTRRYAPLDVPAASPSQDQAP